MSALDFNLAIVSDTSSAFTVNDPVLMTGQAGVEIDTGLFKIGDGLASWSQLTYAVINDRQTIFLTLSTDEGNMLSHGSDGGLLVDSQNLPTKKDIVDAFKNDALFTLEPDTESSSIHAFKQLALVVRNIIHALGEDYNILKDMDNASVVTSLAVRIAQAVADKVTITDVIKDDVETSSSSWSSTQIKTEINNAVAIAVDDLVGSAPLALDTIYEIANQLLANGNLLELLTTAVGGAVRFEIEQYLTVEQKQIARNNIAALGKAEFGNYTETSNKKAFDWFLSTLANGVTFDGTGTYLNDIIRAISHIALNIKENKSKIADLEKYTTACKHSFSASEQQPNTNIWKKVSFSDGDGSVLTLSELIDFDTSTQTFTKRVQKHYDKATLQVVRTITYSLSYDGYGNLINETILSTVENT